MEDREIRRRVQEKRGYFASSRDNGPAHIVLNYYDGALCGVAVNTRAYRRATKMCGNCRRVFLSWQRAADVRS